MRTMKPLDYLTLHYNLDLTQKSPIEIPNVGRDDLAKWLGFWGFNRGAEIGTAAGEYAVKLCENNPSLALTCVDPWTVYEGYRDYSSQAKMSEMYEQAKQRLKPYNVGFIRNYSREAWLHFPDEYLDFVYIDANHELPWVINDIIDWGKKVRHGGVIAGHDYYRSKLKDSRNHTVEAVNAYTSAYRIRPWFLLGSKAKAPGTVRDDSRSWFWIKE